jgi:ABC-type transporter Mla maintaining outer membrane lipid asymmetry ATPase subunit MlaF
MINEQLVGKVDFQVTVSLAFEGLTLKIRGGRIMEILAGSCTGKGAIRCEGCLLVERETAPFMLPGSLKLGDGVPIAP